ncbi:aspartate/glutamate racemase family protein [Agrobacterium sp. SHOUNA12C]|nr:aspartate/glutamate racemase family protein [Agrobacterium sp. BETTINA12B]MCJ9758675.1 aspartate/glutamate racemase family protein [Agrobacterium sp. SHOUNA12C]
MLVQHAQDTTKHIVLINPNTSAATTAMMTDIARSVLPADVTIEGVTATSGVPMILDDNQLAAAAAGVVKMGLVAARFCDGIIVSAFGDPGIQQLRDLTKVPVVGICEASMLEASAHGRRFGIATVTPNLVNGFARKADGLGRGQLFTGTRLTNGDPQKLAADPERLQAELAFAVEQAFELDGAEAVIIGGGPLGQAAVELGRRFSRPVIAPITAAVASLLLQIKATSAASNPSS